MGGRLVPRISEDSPAILKYDTYKKELCLQFCFVAEKGHVDQNGNVYYEQVC